MVRPAFWIVLTLASIASAGVAWRYFPDAFSILALEISTDRQGALEEARAIAARDNLGPDNYRQAASFRLDSRTQTFVELEGGGKDAFTRMLEDGLYFAYVWEVRHFREGETTETRITFAPDGRPWEFWLRLPEDQPGAALDAAAARQIAERDAAARWNVDLRAFRPLEPGEERRPGGRVDHAFTYERTSPTLGQGRFRLQLVVSGDRLTRVNHFVWIPEAFERRYESMRTSNDAIGVGGAVAMVLLYVVGGMGVGLFFMLRRRYVVWRPAIIWGVVIAALQAAAVLNQWPLVWMTYDTALPYSTFVFQQVAVLVAGFIGMAAFFALSFAAAETLTRRAFGAHPQLWKTWGREAGASTAVLGRTAGGYLLVAVFLAYEVLLYLFATRTLGWWAPSEMLLHPDVLATYVPWLGAIANSLQAGFWEECLFRAVPIAGAALIGDRFGRRGTFIAVAFVVQAVVFGAGHAPYPTQPAFARPVELMLPSIGFGLLYLYFGLLPAIVLHFAFDVVWFALPIFASSAPGVWVQQVMVVVVTLVPLGVVLGRRMQAGRWTDLPAASRNVAWTPAAEPPAAPAPPRQADYAPGRRLRMFWTVLAVAGVVMLVAQGTRPRETAGLTVTRDAAAAAASRALAERGVDLGPDWRVLPTPNDGSGGPHAFVYETAGEARWRALRGTYLPEPYWLVRVATFEGDVAERAEEWHVRVDRSGVARAVRHVLPAERPGASLDEESARRLAQDAVGDHFGLDVARGELREVSARPEQLAGRTDWQFVFADATAEPLPQGEPRIRVDVAGDEVAGTGRFIHVPEEWSRSRRAAATLATIVQAGSVLLFGGVVVLMALLAVLAWSRRLFAPGVFVAAALLMFAAGLVSALNGWPAVLAGLPTAQPFRLQVLVLAAAGAAGLTVAAAVIGLVLGAQPHRLTGSVRPAPDVWRLGLLAGLFGAGVLAAASWVQTPSWSDAPDLGAAGAFLPVVQTAITPVTALLTRLAVLLTVLTFVDRLTRGWLVRRPGGGAALFVVGFFGVVAPGESGGLAWLVAGTLGGAAILAAYVTLLRADLTMVPVAVAVMTAVAVLPQLVGPGFPGARAGTLGAPLAIAGVGWWCARVLRVSRPPRAGDHQP